MRFCGSGVVRRIWITLSDRSENVLRNVIIKMYWDDSKKPCVECPIGDFFCMGLGKMHSFENCFFSTAEGTLVLLLYPDAF